MWLVGVLVGGLVCGLVCGLGIFFINIFIPSKLETFHNAPLHFHGFVSLFINNKPCNSKKCLTKKRPQCFLCPLIFSFALFPSTFLSQKQLLEIGLMELFINHFLLASKKCTSKFGKYPHPSVIKYLKQPTNALMHAVIVRICYSSTKAWLKNGAKSDVD